MAQDAFTLYKLIILYMLERAKLPLTNAQISDFILENDYTNYFNIQSAITELEQNRFITITDEGREVLGYCIQEISEAIKKDVESYLDKNMVDIMEDTLVVADYFQVNENEYTARCIVKDGTSNAVEINLNVATEEEASTICARWKDKSQDVYAYLIQQLLAE